MNNIYQKTLANSASFEGIGLHTGKKSKIRVRSGEANTGIIFKRVDLNKNNLVKAIYRNVSSAKLCTTLENEHGVKVSTVEHLLAAIYFANIDNAIIEIDCDEVPIMDGSAKNFLDTFKKIEIKQLSEKRKYLTVSSKIEVIDGNRKISIEPNNQTLEVEFQLNYDNQLIGKQKNLVDFDKDDLNDVSNSRTFCLYEDIEKIKKNGLAKGGSLDNALVVDKGKVLNKEGLRNSKEFVNHKILDLAGDCILSGYRILGKIKCYQGGHELTNLFLRKIFKTKESFKVVMPSDFKASKRFHSEKIEKIAINA